MEKINPLELAIDWIHTAKNENHYRYPNAACLSTVNTHGTPDARIIIVEEVIEEGFIFSTDSRSAKAKHLAVNSNASLTFYWDRAERQLRISGVVELADEKFAQNSFDSRPKQSRATTWASSQSSEIDSREQLEKNYSDVVEKFSDTPSIPKPTTWISYCLSPNYIEFWEAETARLHKRNCYTKQAGSWNKTILQP